LRQSAGTGPIYLIVSDVLELHAAIVGAGLEAADHLRSRPGLEGALARPAAYAHYENADLAVQAAVLAHGLAEGQFFIDGNKRLGLVAMLTFLEVNGFRVEATDRELAAWILDLAAGGTAENLAERIRAALRPAGLP
jgi:death-on-curing protein